MSDFNFYNNKVFTINVWTGSSFVRKGLVQVRNNEHAQAIRKEYKERGYPQVSLDIGYIEHPTPSEPIRIPVHSNSGPIPLLKA